MDREVPADEIATTVPVDRLAPMVSCGPVVVSVCITCKTADGNTVVGPDMFAAVKARSTPPCTVRGAAGAIPQRLQAARHRRGIERGRIHVLFGDLRDPKAVPRR